VVLTISDLKDVLQKQPFNLDAPKAVALAEAIVRKPHQIIQEPASEAERLPEMSPESQERVSTLPPMAYDPAAVQEVPTMPHVRMPSKPPMLEMTPEELWEYQRRAEFLKEESDNGLSLVKAALTG